MAEKGFGVKEVNLIGASGTPTITSPNNLNLNAVNVAISTNATVGGTLSVTGNVSVGGTLTYEDVTSIDSIGIVTAREGVFIPDNKTLKIGNTASNPDFIVYHDGTSTILTNNMNGTTGAIVIQPKSGEDGIKTFPDGAAELYFNSNKKLETSNTGVTVTGTLTATTFSGSGASLTSLPAANLTGTLPAISGANLTNLPADTPTNSDIQVVYTVTANGSSAYRFAGNGVVSTADDPDLYLIRGQKYRFINNSGGSHPFQIREASGGTAYSTGVTNNGAASGNIDFAPTYDSPARLVYQCTSHSGMVGYIYLRDAAGGNTKVGVSTFSGQVTIEGTTQPTFNKGNFGPGSLTLQNNTADNTTDFSQGIIFTDNANNDADGGWVHGGIVCTGTTGYNGNLCFGIDGNGARNHDLSGLSEKMRLNSSGKLRVDCGDMTSDPSSSNIGVQLGNTSSGTLFSNGSATGFSNNIIFINGNGVVGKIETNGSNTNYATSSDYRLKENAVAISDGITRLKTLKPYKFNFKTDPSTTLDGFFAHEVSPAVPEAVSGTKDELYTEDFLEYKVGDPKIQSLDATKLIPLLTASLQEAVAKIETLEAKVAALEGS